MSETSCRDFFDPREAFFVIDSDNLSNVRTKMYGFSVQTNGIFEEENWCEDAAENLDGCGCYVYVEAKEGKVTLKQDFNGSYGIYMFRESTEGGTLPSVIPSICCLSI